MVVVADAGPSVVVASVEEVRVASLVWVKVVTVEAVGVRVVVVCSVPAELVDV